VAPTCARSRPPGRLLHFSGSTASSRTGRIS
jgi:hypothetical protein